MSDESGAQGASAPTTNEPSSASAVENTGTSSEGAAPETISKVSEDAKPAAAANEGASKAEELPAPVASEAATAEPTDDITMSGTELAAPLGEVPTSDATVVTSGAADSKEKTPRRKSTNTVPEHKKSLKKKQSKANLLTHIDAQPGDHFFIRLKGFPLWPGIVVDDDMLPKALSDKRPVTARRADGTWREDLQDGGKNVNERTFPVMYLYTNEFSWMRNTDLLDLNFETVGEVTPKMRKDLQEAHHLASEKHDLEYFKGILREFQENQLAAIAEKEAKKQEKKEKAEAAAAEKKKKASKPKRKSTLSEAAIGDEDVDEDVDMADVDASGELNPEEPKQKTKKRKATADADEGSSTPQRSDSVKKPKIKINNTPKVNGADTPKASAKKDPKPKTSKTKKANGATNGDGATTPVETPLSQTEKREKKEREILFLRHKLQKGLLTKDSPPKEDEMKAMSDFVTKLEGYTDLEVSIIRATKINKVLKAVLKLESIPKEEEFNFKSRATSLLSDWNKILEGAVQGKEAEEKPEQSNGDAKAEQDEPKTEIKEEMTKSAATTEPAALPSVDAGAEAEEKEVKSAGQDQEPVKATLETAPLDVAV